MIQIVSANYILKKLTSPVHIIICNKLYENYQTEINENIRTNQKQTEAEDFRRKNQVTFVSHISRTCSSLTILFKKSKARKTLSSPKDVSIYYILSIIYKYFLKLCYSNIT